LNLFELREPERRDDRGHHGEHDEHSFNHVPVDRQDSFQGARCAHAFQNSRTLTDLRDMACDVDLAVTKRACRPFGTLPTRRHLSFGADRELDVEIFS
jgi:hypothetical protein